MVDKVGDVSGSSPKELALLPCSSSTAGPSPSSPAVAAAADVASSKPNAPNVSNTYPPALATYEDVVANPKVFMSTLEKLHAAMRTKFMIPIIGGKELDLHRLFVEVTSRGGIEKVVRERRWKEITSVFKFPSTATNASFILRKYYISLIFHYEQLYYFGAKGWNRSESDPLPSTSPTPAPVQGSIPPVISSEAPVSPTSQLSKVNPPLGSPVVGVIDGKFEHGYLVTVSVGTQKLHGVLYHISENPTSQAQQNAILNTCNSGRTTTPVTVHRRRRRKKSEMKKRDPSHPKPNRSGYNFFFQEHHARLKPLHPGKDREISKMIGELWSKLTETEKAVYQAKGLMDKQRYQKEMQEYRERLQRSQVISDAVPIQQVHAEPEAVIVQPDQKMEVDEDKLDPEEDLSDEDDQMEDDSPQTPENGSISDGSDSEVKTADKEPEMGMPVDAGDRTESCNVAVEEGGKKDENVIAESNVQDLNL